jgi:hypothetical protein
MIGMERKVLLPRVGTIYLFHKKERGQMNTGEHMLKEELHQCPCCPVTKCVMNEPCLGCEQYAIWLNSHNNLKAENQRLRELILKFDVEDAVDSYELRADNGDYTPNARERFMMKDFLLGVLDEVEQALKDGENNV